MVQATTMVRVPWPAVLGGRLIWAALLAGQLVWAGVVGVTIANGGSPRLLRSATAVDVAVGADVILLLVGLTVTGLRRRRGVGAGDVTTVGRRYVRMTVPPLAALEAAGVFGLAVVLLSDHWWPAAAVPAIAFLVQLRLFPRPVVRSS